MLKNGATDVFDDELRAAIGWARAGRWPHRPHDLQLTAQLYRAALTESRVGQIGHGDWKSEFITAIYAAMASRYQDGSATARATLCLALTLVADAKSDGGGGQ